MGCGGGWQRSAWNSCDCVEVTLGNQAGAGSDQPGLPELHYVGKIHPGARRRRPENRREKFIWSDANWMSLKPGMLLLPPDLVFRILTNSLRKGRLTRDIPGDSVHPSQ